MTCPHTGDRAARSVARHLSGREEIVEIEKKSEDFSAVAVGVDMSGEGDLLGINEVSKRTQW